MRTFRLDAHSYTMATAIEFNHVSKQYRLGVVSTGTIAHDLDRWFQTSILRREDPYLKIGEVNDRASKGSSEYVWALRDIDFKVEQGDVVGIIGKNGAGKSTLLKLLSKVTAPTTGTIRARGRIASLLEVGTGFHQEMTGRENIYMNGAILGMTKQEITSKLDEIVAFSGCERYLDTPVKRYSSGMMVRLGFAVAAHLDPEILVVDEVLAVGDAEFQKKAIGKMQDISHGEGRTVLFVSHNMTAVRNLCKSGVLLENGMMKFVGKIEETLNTYLRDVVATNRFVSWAYEEAPCQDGIRLLSVKIANDDEVLYAGDAIQLEFDIESEQDALAEYNVTFLVRDEMSNFLFEGSTAYAPRVEVKTGRGVYHAVATIPANLMNEGVYEIWRIFFVKDKVTLLACFEHTVSFELKRRQEDTFGYQGEKMGIIKPKIIWKMLWNNELIVSDFNM